MPPPPVLLPVLRVLVESPSVHKILDSCYALSSPTHSKHKIASAFMTLATEVAGFYLSFPSSEMQKIATEAMNILPSLVVEAIQEFSSCTGCSSSEALHVLQSLVVDVCFAQLRGIQHR